MEPTLTLTAARPGRRVRAPVRTLADAFDPRSNALTVLRLALAGTVAVVHALAVGYGHQPTFAGSTLGDVAVDGFFVVSGFLVTRSLLRLPSVSRYAWHRFLRIMPGFWVCLLVTALVVAPLVAVLEGRPATSVFVAPEESALDYVLRNGLLLMRQFGIDGLPASGYQPQVLDGSLWTLFYEAVCYGLVAGLGLAGVLRRAPWTLLVACGLLWAVTIAASAGVVEVGTERLLRFALVFLLGAAGWVWAHRVPVRGRFAAASAVLVAVALVTLEDHRALAAPAFAYLILYLAVRMPWRWDPGVDVSYGLYVYHWPVQQVLALAGAAAVLPSGVFVVVSLVLALPLALASWYAVEAPALRLKHCDPFAHRRARRLHGPRAGTDQAMTADDRAQPTPESTPHPLDDPPQGISVDDADREQAIRAALGEVSFPATREDLLVTATGAREAVVVDLRSLPEGAGFGSYDELLVALGVGSQGRVDVPGAPPRGGF